MGIFRQGDSICGKINGFREGKIQCGTVIAIADGNPAPLNYSIKLDDGAVVDVAGSFIDREWVKAWKKPITIKDWRESPRL